MRHINERGLGIIKTHEGCRLEAYVCPGGVLSIGYGSTLAVEKGMRITQVQADNRLRDDLDSAEQCVIRWVSVELNDNEFSALVSLTYNIGCGAFRGSTLLRKLNASDRNGAQLEFHRWDKSKGVALPGLTTRRAAEAQLFGMPA